MRVTQGTFSFLPDLTDEEIEAQIRYALGHGWAISIEYTDDPHPRNAYWEMWGLPIFDLTPDEATVACARSRRREAFPEHYIKVIAYDPTLRTADDRAELHRQPSAQRAGLPPRPQRTGTTASSSIACTRTRRTPPAGQRYRGPAGRKADAVSRTRLRRRAAGARRARARQSRAAAPRRSMGIGSAVGRVGRPRSKSADARPPDGAGACSTSSTAS